MKLKLDENLGQRCRETLVQAGHDVTSVREQGLAGHPDLELISVCQNEGRALVTLDLDFSNPLRFPPGNYSGIAVLRLPAPANYGELLAATKTLTKALESEPLPGKLWIVEIGRIRVYRPETEQDL
jgi:predicted nuclease of predicted toxin-antitoxin system